MRHLLIGLVMLLPLACDDDDDDPGVSVDGAVASDAAPPDGDLDLPPDASVLPDAAPLPPPEATWKEHWFEHDQLLELVYWDDHVAIFFDDDVPRAGTEWLLPFMSDLWRYTKATYGEDFGPDPRLYSIHHEGRYSGGHPSTYFDASHDFRNVSDIGPGGWQDPDNIDIASHEVAHVVEGGSYGRHGSPAFGVWRDSKWAELFQYDVYLALGMPDHAQRVFDKFTATVDDFPRAGTRWFRDWFYPIYRDHGGSQVMPRFFQLLSQHFRQNGSEYQGGLDFGEFVHFMSGAAGADLKDLATEAFGWPGEREAEWQAARREFPGVTY
jgi:hypothetical protein